LSNILLNDAYENVVRNIVEEIRDVEVCSLTTDGYTSRQRFGYQTLTLHFINNNYELKVRVISLQNIPGHHTGEVLAGWMLEKARSWKLGGKIECITTDNGI
jgi:hypothetical protein